MSARGATVALIGALSACAPAPAPPRPAAPLPMQSRVRTCAEAAVGLEHGTVDFRSPETSVLQIVEARCVADAWPAAAIECFAQMKPGELGRCAVQLPDAARDAMFAALGGPGDDRAAVAIARTRLGALQVNIAECDRFIAAVLAVLACDAMPLEARATIGRDVADFWSLPTKGLPPDAVQRMATACASSLTALEQAAPTTGCE